MPPPGPGGAPQGEPDPMNEIVNAIGQMGQMVDQMAQQSQKLEQRNEQLAQRIEQYESRQSQVDGKLEMMMKILDQPPAPERV